MNIHDIQFFEEAKRFIETLPEGDQGKILSNIKIMSTDLSAVNIKLLKAPIKELKVKKYRLLFFTEKSTIYLVSGFIKKSRKTPHREIQNAEELYKQFKA